LPNVFTHRKPPATKADVMPLEQPDSHHVTRVTENEILSKYAYKTSSGCCYSIHFSIYGKMKMELSPALLYWHEMSEDEDGRNQNRNKRKEKQNGKIGEHGKCRKKTK
jgi:hypothetical protein